MALESKPLFHPEVLRQQVRSFNLPDQTAAWQPKLQEWANLITSGRADDFKETALLPDLLTDSFCGLLGYTGPAGSGENRPAPHANPPAPKNPVTELSITPNGCPPTSIFRLPLSLAAAGRMG